MTDVVQKLWGFCHTLRHDGIDCGDYIEQITFLLFLKMADERGVAPPKKGDRPPPPRHLAAPAGPDPVPPSADMPRPLANQPGILGDIFAEAQCRFNKPVNLKQLIN